MILIQRKTMKTLGIWLLTLFLFAVHVFFRSAHAEETNADSWKEIKSKTGDCKISFPSIPRIMQQSLNVTEAGHQLLYDIYLSPLNEKSLCLLLVATYPFPLKGGHEIVGLQGLLKGIVGHNPDNQLIFANMLEKRGRPVVDFLVQSKVTFFRGQALMIGNKLYLIAIEGKHGELDEKTFDRFVRSFSLIP